MDLKINKINGANASVATKIKAEELAQAEDKIAREFAKKANIAGFRAGKVPVSIVKKRYAKEIKQDAEQDLLQKLLKDGLSELKRESSDVVGEPVFKKFDRDEKKGEIDIEVMISFRPEIKTDGYKECIPEHSTPRVTKKEIEEKRKELLALVAPMKPLKTKRALKKGDFALFDFEGFVDGEAFEGGKAENHTLEIGSGQFIPGFEDGMIGIKPGEEKDVEVKFPDEYQAKNLAGKDAVFKVKLHEIQTKDVPAEPDEDMLKQLLPQDKEPTAEKLDEQIKEQIKNEKLGKLYEEELKPKFVDAVVEKLEFDLPENIVEQELDMQVRQNWQNFTEDEIKGFQDKPDTLQEKRESFREDATKSVKLTFIVDELARENRVEVNDQEVMQALYFEAMQQGQDPKAYVEMYQKQGVLPAVKMAMIEDKLFRGLFFDDKKEAKKTEKKETEKPKKATKKEEK